jgi:HlyD family secretion protein
MPTLQERLFRQTALERLSSPEGLDTMMEVTTLRGWISLAGVALVVLAAMIWGVLGRVPQVVSGQGIMVRQGGVYRIQVRGSGQIDSVLVEPGDTVHVGQTVAVLAQPELRTAIRQLETSLQELRNNRRSTFALLSRDRELALESIRQQQAQADEAVLAATQRLRYLNARITSDSIAYARGLLTPDRVQETVALRSETQLQLLSAAASKQELAARAVQVQVESNQTVFGLDREIFQSDSRLTQLNDQLRAYAHVTSPYNGTIVERLSDPGQAIGAGTAIVTVESSDVPLQVLMFIPLEGKRIEPGMRVEMVPGGVRPEETGYFIGHVRSVSGAPLSGSALDRYLKNEVLVEQFTSEGGAYLVDVVVESDLSTVSTYRWTSRAGAQIKFGSGTLLTGKIVVKQTRPVAMIVPAIRRWLGG